MGKMWEQQRRCKQMHRERRGVEGKRQHARKKQPKQGEEKQRKTMARCEKKTDNTWPYRPDDRLWKQIQT